MLSDLYQGDLSSLEAHLRAAPGHIDPCVARELMHMLGGRSSYVLVPARNPELPPNQHTSAERWERTKQRLRLVLAVGAAGGWKRGQRQRAIFEVSQSTGKAEGWIEREIQKVRGRRDLMKLGADRAAKLSNLRDLAAAGQLGIASILGDPKSLETVLAGLTWEK